MFACLLRLEISYLQIAQFKILLTEVGYDLPYLSFFFFFPSSAYLYTCQLRQTTEHEGAQVICCFPW